MGSLTVYRYNLFVMLVYSITISTVRCVGQRMQKGCRLDAALGSVNYWIEY
jgi:hypothetical protein